MRLWNRFRPLKAWSELPTTVRVTGSLVTLLVLLGTVLRLRQYLFNRSLWLDEALLALSFVHGKLPDLLLLPLVKGQSAPPGFIMAVRSLIVAVGSAEDWVLRFVPLIAGLLVPVVSVFLARRELNSGPARLTLVGLTALSPVLIYYSSEFKQYSSDALIALCIVTAVAYRNSRYGTSLVAATGFFGLIFSLPAVFVAASAGLLLSWEAVRESQFKRFAWVTLTWLGGATVHAAYILKAVTNHESLLNYWRHAFAPLPPNSVDQLLWYPQSFLGLTDLAFRKSGPAMPDFVNDPQFDFTKFDVAGWGLALVLAVSIIMVFWSRRPVGLVAVGSIVVTLLASALDFYPFSSRLLIFLVPLVFFVMATAVDIVDSKLGRLAATTGALILLAIMMPRDASVALEPMTNSDMRGALAQIAPRLQTGDAIGLGLKSDRAYDFYRAGFIPDDIPVFNARYLKDLTLLVELAKEKGCRRLWFISAHRTKWAKETIDKLASKAPVSFEWKGPGTRVLLLDLTAAGPSERR